MTLRHVPIIEQHVPAPTSTQLAQVDRLATAVRHEHPELADDEAFHQLAARSLDDGPSLHLEDLSEIAYLDAGLDVTFMQDRPRLRAGDGDLIASCAPDVPGFEEYARDRLGLGAVEWLHPRSPANPLQVAGACWEDRAVRRLLIHRLRTGQLMSLHPNMGTAEVWELARLLHESSRRRLAVLAAPPALCRWVNDKVAFADTVRRLFGSNSVPPTASAWNLSVLAQHVAEIARTAQVICLKLPDSAGGDSNLLISTDSLRGKSLAELRVQLADATAHLPWTGMTPLLVDQWETSVTCSPSVQTWIPPFAEGPPVIEGIFSQITSDAQGIFVGTTAAQLPDDLAATLATQCWLLALLYQRLGYVGRCSFDAILVGETLPECRIELIECNGRWGGTSLPMTLVNRLFGEWTRQPFATKTHTVPGLSLLTFEQLSEQMAPHLYDHRTGAGWLVLYNGGRIISRSGITTLALSETWEAAAGRMDELVPVLLQQIVANDPGPPPEPPDSRQSGSGIVSSTVW